MCLENCRDRPVGARGGGSASHQHCSSATHLWLHTHTPVSASVNLVEDDDERQEALAPRPPGAQLAGLCFSEEALEPGHDLRPPPPWLVLDVTHSGVIRYTVV